MKMENKQRPQADDQRQGQQQKKPGEQNSAQTQRENKDGGQRR
jgi:hypothetical protein